MKTKKKGNYLTSPFLVQKLVVGQTHTAGYIWRIVRPNFAFLPANYSLCYDTNRKSPSSQSQNPLIPNPTLLT